MAASVGELRRALATRLALIPDVHAYARRPREPMLPALIVLPQSGRAAALGGTAMRHLFRVVIVATGADDETGQDLLDEYLSEDGDRSVRQVLEGDKSLDGHCATLIVGDYDDYADSRLGDNRLHWGAQIEVEVWT